MSQLNLGNNLIIDSDYSTSETETGATWIDGKPVYRKVINGTSPNTTGYFTIQTGITNGDTLINVYGAIKGSNYYISAQYTDPSTSFNIAINSTLSVASCYFSASVSDYKNKPVYLVLEYTKTID